ncbi:hypothetical protein J4407_03480 [Candidatus Pacearchaeota archaeon]|nr:hypothetical protein [Candidatus Pacearchaeota archaeon]
MTWQDIAITVIIIAFSYALLPQVYQGFKQKKGFINLQTSAITSTGMYILCFVYFTLGLYFSTVMAFVTGTLWTILFLQKITYK